MPFGKYKGLDTCEIQDDSYLQWAAENISDKRVQDACRRELIRRGLWEDDEPYQPPPPPSQPHNHSRKNHTRDCPVCISLMIELKTWHRKAAIYAHPDRGGNNQIMQLVNELKDKIAALAAK